MGNVIITAEGSSLLVTQTVAQNPRERSFKSLSLSLGVDSINFYEDGAYKCRFNFVDFLTIGGVAPTNLQNAFDLIIALNPSENGLPITEARLHYDIPSEIPLSINITSVDNVYQHDYNFNKVKNSITGVTYYVNPATGNDANAGTIGSPLKSIKVAIEKTDAKIVYLEPTTYKYIDSWQNASPVNDLKVLINGVGTAEVTTQIDCTFTLTSGQTKTYESANTDLVNAIGGGFDRLNLDASGIAIPFKKVTSIALVESTANSFYYDTVALKVYVHTYNDRAPDANVVILLTVFNGYTGLTDKQLYCENLKFIGGEPMRVDQTGTAIYKEAVFVNCHFSYATMKDGIKLSRKTRSYYSNCRVNYNIGDGFNYNGTSVGFEVNCVGVYNGFNGINKACNGSTSHDSVRVVRLGCNYQYSRGKAIQDVNNSFTYNVNCTAGNSVLLPNDLDAPAFASNSITGDSSYTNMYLINCTSLGTAPTYRNFANSTMYIRGGNLDAGTGIEEVGSTTIRLESYIDIDANPNDLIIQQILEEITNKVPSSDALFKALTLKADIVEYPETVYSQNPTFTGTAPTGTFTANWRATRLGLKVSVRLSFLYGTLGTLVTNVNIPFPTGLPLPGNITGFVSNGDSVSVVNCIVFTSKANAGSATRGLLRRISSTSYEIVLSITSGVNNILGAHIDFEYWA
jgi:hypothetical protein